MMDYTQVSIWKGHLFAEQSALLVLTTSNTSQLTQTVNCWKPEGSILRASHEFSNFVRTSN